MSSMKKYGHCVKIRHSNKNCVFILTTQFLFYLNIVLYDDFLQNRRRKFYKNSNMIPSEFSVSI